MIYREWIFIGLIDRNVKKICILVGFFLEEKWEKEYLNYIFFFVRMECVGFFIVWYFIGKF